MAEKHEPHIQVTPCLSSAKRRMQVWIYEPLDILAIAFVLIFGHQFIALSKCFLFAVAYSIFIAFYKFGKPPGFVNHALSYQLRPKRMKPGRCRAVRRFYYPEDQPFSDKP